MKVKVLKLCDNASVPSKTYETDFCYDCVATSCEEIAPHVFKYGLGVAFQIERDKGDVGAPLVLSIDVRPRSSIWKTGMILSNGVGTVDENYRGEVSAVLYHVMPNMPKYEVGDRIAQIKIGVAPNIEFEVASALTDTDRGARGYGSTDMKHES